MSWQDRLKQFEEGSGTSKKKAEIFEDFDPSNMNQKQRDQLQNDVYGGYKSASVPKYGTRGAGRDGTRTVQTGYDQVTNYGYYKNDPGWSAIADELGINVNSENDIRQLYDYVNGYKPPAAAGTGEGGMSSDVSNALTSFEQRLQEIQNADRRGSNGSDALAAMLSSQQDAYDQQFAAFEKQLTAMNNMVANQAANQLVSQQNVQDVGFNPAMTIGEKARTLSKGTSQLNRKLKINNLNL